MRVLALNYGSSSLKFALFDISAGSVSEIERASVEIEPGDDRFALDPRLRDAGIEAAGHRIVHGGDFDGPRRLTADVRSTIERLESLAPLHNALGLRGVAEVDRLLPSVTQVAVFDTAFHRTMPPPAASYAISSELAERHGIRRYGFHGISHAYLASRLAELTGTPPGEVTAITLHLGNGCSATAVRGGASVDTTMGFTPLEGLVMGTRSGDIDPAVVAFIADREGVSAPSVVERLNRESGLLGVSGVSHDIRRVIEAADAGDQRAAFALDLYAYRVRKYIGAYLAALGDGSAPAIVFSGGVGANQPAIRARACEGLAWAGLRIDPDRNAAAIGVEAEVSAVGSRLRAFVIPTDEERMVARETYRCLSEGAAS